MTVVLSLHYFEHVILEVFNLTGANLEFALQIILESFPALFRPSSSPPRFHFLVMVFGLEQDTKPNRHPEYYFDDGNIIFLVSYYPSQGIESFITANHYHR